MFNIGPAELIVIFLVALLIVGPTRLPEIGRTIGKAMRELRKASDDFRQAGGRLLLVRPRPFIAGLLRLLRVDQIPGVELRDGGEGGGG